ncbi:MAG: SIMPL domain-containing protein [Solirubrobacteraceae bacterium]
MRVRIAAAVAALSLVAAPGALADSTGATGATGTTGTSGSTLAVQGNGRVFLKPDVASLTLTVTRTAPTAKQALGAANTRVDLIVNAIRALGVPASGIQTQSVNTSGGTVLVGPKHHKHRVHRFTASETLQVTTTTQLVGPVIDGATRNGADSISGPNFSFSDPSAGAIAATNAALTDARKRADAAAATLGYKVTGVESVNLDPGSSFVAAGSGGAASTPAPAGKTAPTNVSAGTQEVDAQVQVVYTIAPVS